MRDAREKVDTLAETFSFHDLRYYFASKLIEDGADVKKVQAALRHASAKTTLDTYSAAAQEKAPKRAEAPTAGSHRGLGGAVAVQ